MKHLLISRHFPPTPGGGIGTYAAYISRLLAEAGETIHVIAQQHPPAEEPLERQVGGRLVIHRLPRTGRASIAWGRWEDDARWISRQLARSPYSPLQFAWEAALLAEHLVETEGVDVVEAQEYQAPLYFFQLRRALGLGPERQPPCIVHLHSPTEFIVEDEDVDVDGTYLEIARRVERTSILAADALVAPSRSLAAEVAGLLGVTEPIEVIPLPIGDLRPLPRSADVWASGSVCYLGRLEPRKGILEWIDAAVEAAQTFPEATFDFVGPLDRPFLPDVSVGDWIRARIPSPLQPRFRFHGGKSRDALAPILAQARMVAVPSRWENFPYACVEGLASGVPVVASPTGAMVDMIEPGKTGWLAESASTEAFTCVLREALQTPPQRLEVMGREAAASIRTLCSNEAVLASHLSMRQRLVTSGADRSRQLPTPFNWIGSNASPPPQRTAAPASPGTGSAAVVLNGRSEGTSSEITRLFGQHQAGAPRLVIVDRATAQPLPDASYERGSSSVRLRRPLELAATSQNAGFQHVMETGPPLGVFFLDPADRPRHEIVETCERVLRARPEVGVVSFWVRAGTRGSRMDLSPAFPYQWLRNETVPMACFRAEAVREVGGFRALHDESYALWDLVNRILLRGWQAVTVPAVLAETSAPRREIPAGSHAHTVLLRKLLEPQEALLDPDRARLLELSRLALGPLTPRSWSEALGRYASVARTRLNRILPRA